MNETPVKLCTNNKGDWICPLCGGLMRETVVHNALSRIDNETYICNDCGQKEALQFCRPRAGEPRECLYYDEIMGIGIVTENEAGYHPFAPQPAAPGHWCERYIRIANEKLDLDESEVLTIVASSFAAQNQMEDFMLGRLDERTGLRTRKGLR